MESRPNNRVFTLFRQPSLGLSLRDDYQTYRKVPNTKINTSENIKMKTKALHSALQQAGHSLSSSPIEYLNGKAPTINSDWILSLSHSGTWLYAGAMSTDQDNRDAYFGIDIEQIKKRNFLRLSSFLGWQQPSMDETHFYRRWTLFESLFKALSNQNEKNQLSTCFDMLDNKLLENIYTSDAISININGWFWQVEWPRICDDAITCVTYGLAPKNTIVASID